MNENRWHIILRGYINSLFTVEWCGRITLKILDRKSRGLTREIYLYSSGWNMEDCLNVSEKLVWYPHQDLNCVRPRLKSEAMWPKRISKLRLGFYLQWASTLTRCVEYKKKRVWELRAQHSTLINLSAKFVVNINKAICVTKQTEIHLLFPPSVTSILAAALQDHNGL